MKPDNSLPSPIINSCPYGNKSASHLKYVKCLINGVSVRCMLDTGCTRTCFRLGANFLDGLSIHENSSQILCANSDTMPSSGSVKTILQFTQHFKPEVDALVIKNLSAPVIIGMDIIQDLTLKKNSKSALVNGFQLPLCQDETKSAVCHTEERVHLNPMTETFIKIKNPLVNQVHNLIAVDALDKQKYLDPITVSPSVNMNEDYISVLLTNKTNKTKYLPRRSPICTVENIQIAACNGVTEVSDLVKESEEVRSFQTKRLQKAKKAEFNPECGSVEGTQSEKQQIADIIQKYRMAFSMGQNDLGKLGYFRFTLPLLDETETAHQPPRPIPIHLKEKVNDEIHQWKQLGIIEETQSGFNIPLIILKKPDNSIRISLDARQLNTKLRPDRFPLPHLTDTLSSIGMRLSKGKDCYVSTFDFMRGYWNVQVKEEDKHKLAFSHNQKHYTANRMLYGTSTAPSCFSRIMNKLFGNHPSFLVYLDDLIVIDSDFESHKESIKFLLKKCIKYGLLLSAKKCHIAKKSINFLGHTIDSDGIKPLEKHVKAIRQFDRPTTKSAVKTFLGLVNFNLKFCEGGSECLAPLHQICSPRKEFVWTDREETAFQTIKQKLINAKGLYHRNPDLRMTLVADASLHGAGATLYQTRDGKFEVIGYFSRSFSPADKKRGMRVKELLALSYAIRHFEYFLINTQFDVVTDHKSLLYLYREHMKTNLDLKLVNVFVYLQNYDFKIYHQPGNSPIMQSADALSRLEKFSLDELDLKCEENNIPDRVFALIHTPNNDDSTSMKTYLRALARGNENQEPIPDEKDYGKTLLRFEHYKFDETTMKERQSQCKTIANILRKLEMKNKRISKKFELHDEILYNTTKQRKRLVLPDDISSEFLKYTHTSYGHAGEKQLSRIISNLVYIPKLQEKCHDVCRLCVDCLRWKPRKQIKPSLIEKKTFESTPWTKTSVDVWDIGKKDRRQKRYLLTCVDHLTGFLECRPMANKSEDSVTKAMTEMILQHGIHGTVITDNGAEFSGDFTDVLDKFKILHVRTAAYMSRSNSKVERVHREINGKLRLLDVKRAKWSEHILFIQFILNNLPKSSLDGLSAAEALYGRSLYQPFEVIQPTTETTQGYTEALNDYLNELHPSLMSYQFQKYSRLLEKDQTKTPVLKIGSRALIWKPTITNGKISKCWSGPYKVVKRISKHSYVLVDEETRRSYRRNIRHLRPLATKQTNENDETLDADQNHIEKQSENKETDAREYLDEFQNRFYFSQLPSC